MLFPLNNIRWLNCSREGVLLGGETSSARLRQPPADYPPCPCRTLRHSLFAADARVGSILWREAESVKKK